MSHSLLFRGVDQLMIIRGFGSIVVSDPEEMTRCVVDAVVDADVYAILSKGWSDRGSKAKGEAEDTKDGADGIKYPPTIFPIDSIDHSWLFTRIDAACHHGGAGTTGASLRAGIVSDLGCLTQLENRERKWLTP